MFEAISHPIRIKVLKLLAKRPMSFSELKRELGIKSSGKLDFHLKKLGNLVTLNSEDKYALTKEGYAALQTITTVRKYGWQKRAYIVNMVAYAIVVLYTLNAMSWKITWSAYTIVLIAATVWFVFYSYWSIVKRKVFRT
ncbi:MAG: hypothetical protein DRN04_11760 [Thermoprotei archaeon]|nr:MAG: hypothetical protein DRN04_11760 [Thermoprotei archaeon]